MFLLPLSLKLIFRSKTLSLSLSLIPELNVYILVNYIAIVTTSLFDWEGKTCLAANIMLLIMLLIDCGVRTRILLSLLSFPASPFYCMASCLSNVKMPTVSDSLALEGLIHASSKAIIQLGCCCCLLSSGVELQRSKENLNS